MQLTRAYRNQPLREVLFRYSTSRKKVVIFDRLKTDGWADENQKKYKCFPNVPKYMFQYLIVQQYLTLCFPLCDRRHLPLRVRGFRDSGVVPGGEVASQTSLGM